MIDDDTPIVRSKFAPGLKAWKPLAVYRFGVQPVEGQYWIGYQDGGYYEMPLAHSEIPYWYYNTGVSYSQDVFDSYLSTPDDDYVADLLYRHGREVSGQIDTDYGIYQTILELSLNGALRKLGGTIRRIPDLFRHHTIREVLESAIDTDLTFKFAIGPAIVAIQNFRALADRLRLHLEKLDFRNRHLCTYIRTSGPLKTQDLPFNPFSTSLATVFQNFEPESWDPAVGKISNYLWGNSRASSMTPNLNAVPVKFVTEYQQTIITPVAAQYDIGLANEVALKMDQLGLTSIVSMVYELLPLSFVIDWFVKFSDFASWIDDHLLRARPCILAKKLGPSWICTKSFSGFKQSWKENPMAAAYWPPQSSDPSSTWCCTKHGSLYGWQYHDGVTAGIRRQGSSNFVREPAPVQMSLSDNFLPRLKLLRLSLSKAATGGEMILGASLR